MRCLNLSQNFPGPTGLEIKTRSSMEGTSELNDTLDDSVAAPKVKTKENDPSHIPDNCNPMEIPAFSGSQDNIWFFRSRGKNPNNLLMKKTGTHRIHQPYVDPMMRSPRYPSDNLEDKDVTGCIGSQSQSENHHMNLCPNDDAGRVAELTVSNYKSSRVSLDGCSNIRDAGNKQKGWKVLYVDEGESRNWMSTEDRNVGSEGVANLYLNPFHHQRSLPRRHKDYSIASESSTEAKRNKAVEEYDLPESLVRDVVKGKRIAYKHLGSHDAPQTPLQTYEHEMPRRHSDADSNHLNCHGMSLREWLTTGLHNSEKSERFLIFRGILELVDSYHSQGLALQNLSPSFLVLKSPVHVKYIGSIISQSTNIDQDSFCSVNLFKRKSKLEVDKQHSENVSVKQQRLSESREFHMFGSRDKIVDPTRIKVQDLNRRNLPQFSADGEHKIRSVTSNQDVPPYNIQKPAYDIFQLEEMWYTSPEQINGANCSFSSNIYSLGVLLFEVHCKDTYLGFMRAL